LARILGAIGRLLIGVGLLLLAFVAFQLWGTGLEESSNQDALANEIGSSLGVSASGDDPIAQLTQQLGVINTEAAPATEPPQEGQAAGVIVIPRIGVSKVFVEGTAKVDLKKGPGHYQGTPLPGQAGNSAIAGHRTTYGAPFNRIDELSPGDQIEIYTAQGKFIYEVMAPPDNQGIERGAGYWTVRPEQGEVVGPLEGGGNMLTLTACHPKYSAKQRIIVRAKLTTPPAATPVIADTPQAPQPTETDDLDKSFAGDPDALTTAILWGVLCAAIFLVAWFASRRWRKWPTYLLATPLFLGALWFCFIYTDRYLPSL